jgi:hypothetical protein
MIAPPLAHAGHVVEGVLYAIPILVVAVVIVLQRIRERAGDADGAPPLGQRDARDVDEDDADRAARASGLIARG